MTYTNLCMRAVSVQQSECMWPFEVYKQERLEIYILGSWINCQAYIIYAWQLTHDPNIYIYIYPIINLKDTFFEPAVGSRPHFNRM